MPKENKTYFFDRQYRFYGKHALRVDALTAVFDTASKAQLFHRNLDVYINAPLIGFLYGRMADRDDTRNPANNQVYDESIMGEQVIHAHEELLFHFRLIMLLDKVYEPNEEERINKALRYMGKNPADMERFDSYVRGGVDILYEKLIEGSSSADDYINKLYEFLEDFQDKFNEQATGDIILKLCSK